MIETRHPIWKIEFTDAARKDFKKLDRAIQKRIHKYLTEHIAHLEDPRQTGKPLRHNMKGLWRFRIADTYRVICEIQDHQLMIFVIEAGHRRKIY